MDRIVIEDWKAVFEQWKASGLSQKEFCREQGIGLSRFHYHRKRLAKERVKTQASEQELIQIAELATDRFQTELVHADGAELHLGTSAVLKISSDIQEELLHKILRAVIACGRT
jgi:hypothetical protein